MIKLNQAQKRLLIMNRIIFIIISVLFFHPFAFADISGDEYMDELLKDVEISTPIQNLNYNYESVEKIPIRLNITETITTKKDGIYDFQPLKFVVKENVKYKNKVLINKGAIVNANVAIYNTRGMNGIPGCIIIDNFNINGIDNNKLKGVYIKKGLNLSLMVYPIKWALTPIPGVGSLTNFILGGNAKITPKDTVIIYYYPKWNEKIH